MILSNNLSSFSSDPQIDYKLINKKSIYEKQINEKLMKLKSDKSVHCIDATNIEEVYLPLFGKDEKMLVDRSHDQILKPVVKSTK
jgi:hypothetical protein